MKKTIRLLAIMFAMMVACTAKAHDFSAVAPSGQTLYYRIYYTETFDTSTRYYLTVTYPDTGWTGYTRPAGMLVIPSSFTYNGITCYVNRIGEGAFQQCTGLTGVEIPYSVHRIGSSAFAGCTGLSRVDIVDTVVTTATPSSDGTEYVATIVNLIIETLAFSGCSSIDTLVIPRRVNNIGWCAFANCNSLSIVYYNARNAQCNFPFGAGGTMTNVDSSLYALYVGNSVVSINEGAFATTSFRHIYLGNSVHTIGENAFFECTRIVDTIVVPVSVTSIGEDAFFQVPHILYNGNATGGPWGALDWVTTRVTEDSLIFADSTKSDLVGYVGGISNAVIPSTVTSIALHFFKNCASLRTVTVPGSVGEIPAECFWGCDNLESVVIGNGVTAIRESAFAGCSQLQSVDIPNSVTSIGGNAFEGCSALASVNIPPRVKYIPGSAFLDCSQLRHVQLPDSLIGIGYSAFANCRALDSLHIPASVVAVLTGAFRGCTELVSIVVDAGNAVYDSRNNCNAIVMSVDTVFIDGGAVLAGEANTLVMGCRNTTIPSTVTAIGPGAFYGCTSLTSITVPNSVVSIGDGAFYGAGIDSIVIPPSVTSIGRYAFAHDTALVSVSLPPSITTIGEGVFSVCTSLRQVEIPDAVTGIGKEAFSYCSSLEQIDFGTGVRAIGEMAFLSCDSLRHVEFPDSVTSIGWGAFAHCSSLEQISWGTGVRTIGERAFQYCSALLDPNLPDSLTTIGQYAFYNCDHMTWVTIPASVTSIGDYAFYHTFLYSIRFKGHTPPAQMGWFAFGVDGNLSLWADNIHVPCGTRDVYESAIGYQGHYNYLEEEFEYRYEARSNSEDYGMAGSTSDEYNPDCDDNEWVIEAIPHEGYQFLHWDDGNTDNPRTMYVTSDTTVTAIFVKRPVINATPNNITYGNVTGSGTYDYGAPCTVEATAYSGYVFLHWSNGVTYNPYSFAAMVDLDLTAIFVPVGTVYNLTVLPDDVNHGSTSGGGPYAVFHEATISATPFEGYAFSHWQDGNTDNPRTVRVVGDSTYTAYFVADNQGIEAADDVVGNIRAADGCILVDSDEEVAIYAVDGRLVDAGRKREFVVPATGVYFVRVGVHPVRKVVVVK